jgi:beta-phosphoglucomutase-like phosphatase (HAD superfamily)
MKLKLPDGNFRAYLFDCDGTIVNSMPLHYIAWKTVLAKWNCVYDEALFYSWGGKPTREIVSDLNKMQGLNMPVESVVEQKENLYFELLPQLHAIPEVVEHMEAQQGRIPFAVVSGGGHEAVVRSLTAVGLLEKFDTIVGAEHAERLGVAPGDCLVFEDTDMGIQAATAAGMASVKVPRPTIDAEEQVAQ